MLLKFVGIAVLDHLPLGVDHVEAPARHCTFVGKARQGRAVWAAGEEVDCPMARFNLGIDPPDAATLDRLAEKLVSWERAKDIDAARRFISQFRPLPFGERVFVYFPLDAAPFPPDVVVHVLSPLEAMLTIREIAVATGGLCEARTAGVGAMCGECTAVPLLTHRPTISIGCRGSRREAAIDDGEVLLAVPHPLEVSG